MWDWIKRIIVFLVVFFFLFLIIAQPARAAEIVNNIFAGISTVFNAIISFFQNLHWPGR
jgi:hypothetical protein